MPSSSSSSSSEEDRTRRATRRFLRAARRGNLRKLKRRFRKCPSLDIEARVPSSGGDVRDAHDAAEGGRTAMHLACAAGAEDVVKWEGDVQRLEASVDPSAEWRNFLGYAEEGVQRGREELGRALDVLSEARHEVGRAVGDLVSGLTPRAAWTPQHSWTMRRGCLIRPGL